MKSLFNIVAICSSAMFAGVLLAIGVILGGYWKKLSESDFMRSFNEFASFILPTVSISSLALISLGGSIWFSWEENDVRTLWLLATGCLVALLVLTGVWFWPTNSQFKAQSIPLDQVLAKRDLWLQLHSVRIVLATLASVFGLLALQ